MPVMEQNMPGAGVIFADGYLSGIAGEPRAANPQKTDGDAASVWFDGWDKGDAKRVLNGSLPASLSAPSQS